MQTAASFRNFPTLHAGNISELPTSQNRDLLEQATFQNRHVPNVPSTSATRSAIALCIFLKNKPRVCNANRGFVPQFPHSSCRQHLRTANIPEPRPAKCSIGTFYTIRNCSLHLFEEQTTSLQCKPRLRSAISPLLMPATSQNRQHSRTATCQMLLRHLQHDSQ